MFPRAFAIASSASPHCKDMIESILETSLLGNPTEISERHPSERFSPLCRFHKQVLSTSPRCKFVHACLIHLSHRLSFRSVPMSSTAVAQTSHGTLAFPSPLLGPSQPKPPSNALMNPVTDTSRPSPPQHPQPPQTWPQTSSPREMPLAKSR